MLAEKDYKLNMNHMFILGQGVTKRCRLSLLTNLALSYMSPNAGGGGSCGVSANGYSCTQDPK
jgi:hypothetical protein